MKIAGLPFIKIVRRKPSQITPEERKRLQLERRLKYLRETGRYYEFPKEERTPCQ